MSFYKSKEHSYISARDMDSLKKAAMDSINSSSATERDFDDLKLIGIDFNKNLLKQTSYAMDSIQPTVTTGSIPVPVQFFQNMLTGTVNVLTSARKSDELVGQSVQGAWEDEEVIQRVLEHTGKARSYGDHTNTPLANWNLNFVRQTVVRFEEGLLVGRLEEARTARVDLNSSDEKRAAVAMSLEINRNDVAFNGYNDGNGRTYGLLNYPSLLDYNAVAGGASTFTEWKEKTFNEIVADLNQGFAGLLEQSGGQVDPRNQDITLAVALNAVSYLHTPSDIGNITVYDWLMKNYPNTRVVSVPEFNGADGGADVAYLYADSIDDGSTDDGRTFIQVIPSKLTMLGVEQKSKGYIEAYTNATAGVIAKRPFAVYRMSGI